VTDAPVKIDPALIDREIHDVDWLVLDHKVKSIVEDVFKQLGAPA